MSFCGVWTPNLQQWQTHLHPALECLASLPGSRTHSVTADDVLLGVINGASCVAFGSTNAIAVAIHGQLFDRSAVLANLGLDGHDPTLTDAVLLAHAYRKDGEAFTSNIDGEFAFALWDGARRKLILGRDVVGRGALYYCTAGDTFIFATEPRALFAFGIPAQPDEEAIVRTMSTRYEVGRTIFRGVRYPPSAHHVIVERGKPHRLLKVWQPEEQTLLHLKDTREYPEALHAALLRAVEVRLPAAGVVASQLSAGFDSSGVTALVAQALARQNRPLLAYTSSPTHLADASAIIPGWFSDEWPLAQTVAALYPNIEHIRIPTGGTPWLPALDAMTQVYTGPLSFIRNAAWIDHLHRNAQARGTSVMFNGQIGNLTSSYDGSYSLFDLRRRGNWIGLARAIAWRRQRGTTWRGLLMKTWMPSAAVRAAARRVRGKNLKSFYDGSLLRHDFYRSTGVPELSEFPIGNPIDGDRRNSAAWRLSTMRLLDFGGIGAGDQRIYGMRRADPTADRRVIELCLSIPDEAYILGNQPRDLYREAMRNLLPPQLLAQSGGGLQASDFLENFGDGIQEFRDEMRLLHNSTSAARVLDLERMQALLDQWPSNLTENRGELDLRYNYTFGGALVMGRFLRKLESNQLPWAAPPA